MKLLRAAYRPPSRLVFLLAASAAVAAMASACIGERTEAADMSTGQDTGGGADTEPSDTSPADTASGDTSQPGDTQDDTAVPTDTAMTDTSDEDTTVSDADDDAGADADADATVVTGPATVQIVNAAGDSSGVPVVSHAGDGSVLSTTMTDADGLATIEVVEGGWITTDAAGVLGERILISIADVAPGDAIQLGGGDDNTEDPLLGSIEVLVDFANLPAIDHVFGSNGCAVTGRLATQETASLPLYESCAHPETPGTERAGLMMAWGFDTNGQLVQHSLLSPVSLGTTPRIATWLANVFHPEISIASTPDRVIATEFDAHLDVEGLGVEVPTAAISLTSASLGDVITVSMPGDNGDSLYPLDYRLSFVFDDLTMTTLEVDTNLPFTGASIDAASDLLPPFDSVAVDPAPRPVVTWSAASRMSAADGLLALLTWQSAVGPRRWAVIYPAGSGSAILLPELPDALAPQGPTAQTTQFDVTMMATDASFLAGYDALRAEPIRAFSDVEAGETEYTLTRSLYNAPD